MAGFIAEQRERYGIPHVTACRAIAVSPGWFYTWRHGDGSPRRARREQLAAAIKQLYAAHRGRYGSPRITRDLREAGWQVSKNTVAQLMQAAKIRGRTPRRWKKTTLPDPAAAARVDTGASRLHHERVGDQLALVRRHHLRADLGRLALPIDSVLDMGSRRVVGFALGEHHGTELAYAALCVAVAIRGGKQAIAGVVFHTDQGSEYTARAFRAACERIGIKQSMGRPGSALDNAVIESWHATLEFELRRVEHYATKTAARVGVAAWIDDYNRDRRHSAVGMISPIAYEQTLRAQASSEPDQAA